MEPLDAIATIGRVAADAGRKTAVALPPEFVRQHAQAPPAARLLQARRGGDVAVRLYLLLVMQATGYPRDFGYKTIRHYSKMLDLDTDSGRRRVSKAMQRLEDLQLVVDEETKQRHQHRLPFPDGNGKEWARTKGGRYVGMPLDLWLKGWVLRLSGRELIILTALRELTGGRTGGVTLDRIRKAQYGVSDDTWTRAAPALERHGFLTVTKDKIGDDYTERRVRRRYHLHLEAASLDPADWP